VQVRNVVAAIEIVIDVDLPIAVERVSAPLEEAELGNLERSETRHDGPKKFLERNGVRVEMDWVKMNRVKMNRVKKNKDEVFPRIDRHGH